MSGIEGAKALIGRAKEYSEIVLGRERLDPQRALIIRDSTGQLDHLDELPRMMHPQITYVVDKVLTALPQGKFPKDEHERASLHAFALNLVKAQHHLKTEQRTPHVLIGEGTGLFVALALNNRLSYANAAYLTMVTDQSVRFQRETMRGDRVLLTINDSEEAFPDSTPSDREMNFDSLVNSFVRETSGLKTQVMQRFSNEAEIAVDPANGEAVRNIANKISRVINSKYFKKNVSRKSVDMRGYRARVDEEARSMKIGIGGRYRVFTELGEELSSADLVRFSLANFEQRALDTRSNGFFDFLTANHLNHVTDRINVRLPEVSGRLPRKRLKTKGAAIVIAAAGVGAATYWNRRRKS